MGVTSCELIGQVIQPHLRLRNKSRKTPVQKTKYFEAGKGFNLRNKIIIMLICFLI
jgi:hypothetical protein